MHTRSDTRTDDDAREAVIVISDGKVVAQLWDLSKALRLVAALARKQASWRLVDAQGVTFARS